MIPEKQLIANVDGVMNAVLVQADAVGPTLYYGAGAGDEPTASAVVADIVDVARALTSDPHNRVPHLAFQSEAIADIAILDISEVETAFYLRICVRDQSGVLADMTKELADNDINIEAITQKDADQGQVNIIILTHVVREGNMDQAIASLEQLEAVTGKVSRIRVESLS
jgi:homoserine dehydrogenase